MPSKFHINASLTENLCGFVDKQVQSGRFGNASEVVRASLRLLERELGSEGGRQLPELPSGGSASATDHLPRAILESAIDYGIISFDLEGRVTSWNEGARRIFGWTEADMLGAPADRIFTPEDVAIGRPSTEMGEALRTGRGNDERWHLRADGSRFWAAGEMMALRDEAGDAIGFMKMLRDRTEQHQTMRALLDDRTRTEIAVDTGLIGFFEWDVANDRLRGDRRFAELHGMPADTVDAGRPLAEYMELLHRDDVAAVEYDSKAAIADAADYTLQFRLHRVGADDRHLFVRGRCVGQQGGRTTRYIGIAIDITAAKLAESALRDTEEFNRRVLAASGDCIKVLDLDGTLRFISEGGRKIMEVDDAAQVIGTPWLDRWTGETRWQAEAALAAARQGSKGRFSGHALTAKGNLRFWDVVVTPILGSDGRPERLLSISRDMTRAHEAERTHEASESRWRDVFEKLEEGFIAGEVVRDAAGDIVDWRYHDVNEAWGRQVGIDAHTAVGRTIRDLFPGIEDDWIDQVADVVETGRSATFTRQVGNLGRWYEGRIYSAGDERFSIIFLEVTERLAAEQRRAALLALGDQLLAAADIAGMSAVAAETIGRALNVSCVGYGTLDPDGDRLVVERDWTAAGAHSVAGEHRMSSYGVYVHDLRAGSTVAIPNVTHDPRTRDAAFEEIGICALLNLPLIERGRLAALLFVLDEHTHDWSEEEVAFARDVAERTRQAIERRRAEDGLRALAASLEEQVELRTRERDRIWRISHDPFLIADADGRWLSVNPAWTEILGWSEAELVGRTSEWMEHPDDRLATRQEVGSLSEGQVTQRFENRFRGRDGAYHWFSWTAVSDEGMLFCVARDITHEKALAAEREQLEEQLRQSQKMEAVGQLTGGLAHDFNNLLTGITGSLEMMQIRLAQGRAGDVDRYVTAAQGAAKRAAALTHRLLAFSRRQTLAPKVVDVNALVAGMEELIQRTVGPQVDLTIEGAANLWNTLVDPSQLENALLNLCINARDAMPSGGRIVVETANRHVEPRFAKARDLEPGRYVALSVTDSGTGMPPEVIERVFDPFFTTKPIGVGTGLGLSMIYGFLRQSGGQVRIHSEVGKGTTVTLYLPRDEGSADAEDPDASLTEAPRAAGSETVLVIDDEPTVRLLVAEVLTDLGYTALEAGDGAAGLKLLRSDAQIDLLVTDVGLPGGMNGRQVADAARGIRPDLKVLFITGFAENAVLSHGHLDPGMHVLTKPFALEALASRIRELLTA